MTKKHFQALADALAVTRPYAVTVATDDTYAEAQASTWHATRKQIAEVCARFNPNFDRARFIAATEE